LILISIVQPVLCLTLSQADNTVNYESFWNNYINFCRLIDSIYKKMTQLLIVTAFSEDINFFPFSWYSVLTYPR